MKIEYDNIKEPKPRWKVGDVIYNANTGCYLVAKVKDLNSDVTGAYLYALIHLDTGNGSSESYGTVNELQRYLCDESDMILDGTFKYIGREG